MLIQSLNTALINNMKITLQEDLAKDRYTCSELEYAWTADYTQSD